MKCGAPKAEGGAPKAEGGAPEGALKAEDGAPEAEGGGLKAEAGPRFQAVGDWPNKHWKWEPMAPRADPRAGPDRHEVQGSPQEPAAADFPGPQLIEMADPQRLPEGGAPAAEGGAVKAEGGAPEAEGGAPEGAPKPEGGAPDLAAQMAAVSLAAAEVPPVKPVEKAPAAVKARKGKDEGEEEESDKDEPGKEAAKKRKGKKSEVEILKERLEQLPLECHAERKDDKKKSWIMKQKGRPTTIEVNIDPKKTPHFYVKGGTVAQRHCTWGKLGGAAKAWVAAKTRSGWS